MTRYAVGSCKDSELSPLLAPVTDISPLPEGVWLYAKITEDNGWEVIPYTSEIEALRELNDNSGGWVRWVPYGGLYHPDELEPPVTPETDPRDVALDEIQAAWAGPGDDTTVLRRVRRILEGTGR